MTTAFNDLPPELRSLKHNLVQAMCSSSNLNGILSSEITAALQTVGGQLPQLVRDVVDELVRESVRELIYTRIAHYSSQLTQKMSQ